MSHMYRTNGRKGCPRKLGLQVLSRTEKSENIIYNFEAARESVCACVSECESASASACMRDREEAI